jgi:hypothetical protein
MQIMVLGGALSCSRGGRAFGAAPWPTRVVGDARCPSLLAWWAAPDALACSRGGLPPWLRGDKLMCLPATDGV